MTRHEESRSMGEAIRIDEARNGAPSGGGGARNGRGDAEPLAVRAGGSVVWYRPLQTQRRPQGRLSRQLSAHASDQGWRSKTEGSVLSGLTNETAISQRYRRRGSSVEVALIKKYLASASVRRVENIIEALWRTRVSPAEDSCLIQKICAEIDYWRNCPIEGLHPYLYLDGGVVKIATCP